MLTCDNKQVVFKKNDEGLMSEREQHETRETREQKMAHRGFAKERF